MTDDIVNRFEPLLNKLDIMAEGMTPQSSGQSYDWGDYWNACEEAANAIRLQALEITLLRQKLRTAKKDGVKEGLEMAARWEKSRAYGDYQKS